MIYGEIKLSVGKETLEVVYKFCPQAFQSRVLTDMFELVVTS